MSQPDWFHLTLLMKVNLTKMSEYKAKQVENWKLPHTCFHDVGGILWQRGQKTEYSNILRLARAFMSQFLFNSSFHSTTKPNTQISQRQIC